MKRFVIFGILLATPLFSGVRIQSESTDLATGEVTKDEILIDASRIRVNQTGKSTNSSFLFLTDGGRNRMVMLEKDRNEYRVIDQQTIDQLSGQVSAAMAQMQAQMKNMTPEQRAAMEKMMAGRGTTGAAAASRTVFTAKGTGSVNGFACTKYEGYRGAEKVDEVCAASPESFKLSASDLQVYEKMKEFMGGIMNMANSMLPKAKMSDLGQAGYVGFPVEQISFSSGKAAHKSEVKSVDRATFTGADFSLGNAKQVDLMPAQGRGTR